jgi:isoleucyl-tRNA synthetase
MAEVKKSAHSEREEAILTYWDEQNCFERSINERDAGRPYVFYDGPPFATGLPHYGHLLQSITKDIVPRYYTMQGYRVDRKWGWDCHGLPIEAIVEKDFDLKNRDEIIEMGVDKFNNACDARIMTYAEEWKETIRRIGRWVDMDNAYMTKDKNFMESVWWVFKSLYEKGLIYEGYKIMHISPALETVLSSSEVSQNYQDVKDISAYASFTLTSGDYAGAKVIAWTTTPWTLIGNALLAVHGDLNYAVVSFEGAKYIVATELVGEAFEGKEGYEVESHIEGKDLIGTSYEPLFPYFKDHINAFRIVHGDFVTTDEGTGIVHIAPAFGTDDFELGKAEEVEPILHVEMNGRFIREVEEALVGEGYEVARPIKAPGDTMTVDIEIIKWLAHNDKLFAKKKIEHSYPLCWRTDCPLINYATTSWFVDVQKVKDQMIRSNKEINWQPEHIKEGRFGKGIESAPDWSISRSRFWGTPLPIWRAEDGEVLVVGSVEELKELSGVEVDDLHKHIVDEITIEKDGKTFTRIPDVLDCWFESGSMPYASKHYPFENEADFSHGFPAEFIAEAQDQTRGWFYTLHVLANALFDMPAFKNVIVSGHIMAEDGKKMSKRLKNYPDPQYMLDRYGADAIRYYIASSQVVAGENLNFIEKDVDEIAKKYINILRNVYSFYDLYRAQDDGAEPSADHPMDAWILSRLGEVQSEIETRMEKYELAAAARTLLPFVTDLSTWYVRRSRERVKGAEGAEAQMQALRTLRFTLEHLAKLTAPFTPFIAEEIYQGVHDGFMGGDYASVHLELWPEAPQIDEQILRAMTEARAIVSRILEAREEAGIAVKQALGKVSVTTPSGEVSEALQQVILEEVNMKEMTVEKGDLAAEVDVTITPELRREGMARDLIRRVNGKRKEIGLTIDDKVKLYVSSESDEIAAMLSEHGSDIERAVQAIETVHEVPKDGETVTIQDAEVVIGIETV